MKGSDEMQRDNITYKHGGIWEVRCRGCDTPIRKMIADDAHRETKKINGQNVVFERLVLACLPNYREVLVECGGGPGDNFLLSAHVACMCETCATALTVEKAQAHYDLDLDDLQLPKAAVNEVVNIALHISAT